MNRAGDKICLGNVVALSWCHQGLGGSAAGQMPATGQGRHIFLSRACGRRDRTNLGSSDRPRISRRRTSEARAVPADWNLGNVAIRASFRFRSTLPGNRRVWMRRQIW
jgi:hypothetical protein